MAESESGGVSAAAVNASLSTGNGLIKEEIVDEESEIPEPNLDLILAAAQGDDVDVDSTLFNIIDQLVLQEESTVPASQMPLSPKPTLQSESCPEPPGADFNTQNSPNTILLSEEDTDTASDEEETDEQESSNGFAKFPASSEGEAHYIDSIYASLRFTKKCYLCYSIFPSTTALNSHFMVDHYGALDNTSPNRCGFCGFSFRSDAILKDHRAVSHPNEGEDRPWACEACGARFGEWRCLRQHRQRMYGKATETDSMALYWVGSEKEEAQSRARNYSRVKWTWRCEQCPVLFAQVAELKRHRQRSHILTSLLTEENLVSKPEEEGSSSHSWSASSSNYQPSIRSQQTAAGTSSSGSTLARARPTITQKDYSKVSKNGAQTPSNSNLTASTLKPVVRQQQANSGAIQKQTASSSKAPVTPNGSLTSPAPTQTWFCCPSCSAMFHQFSSLMTHERNHHRKANANPTQGGLPKQNPFKWSWQCERCPLRFVQQVDLAKHRKDVHQLTTPSTNLVAMVGNQNQGVVRVSLSAPQGGISSAQSRAASSQAFRAAFSQQSKASFSQQFKSTSTPQFKASTSQQSKAPSSSQKLKTRKKRRKKVLLTPPPSPKAKGPRPKNRYQLASEGVTPSTPIEPPKPKPAKKEDSKLPRGPSIWLRPGPWEPPVTLQPTTSVEGMPAHKKMCPLCPPSTAPTFDLTRHLGTHILGRPWRCHLCHSSFKLLNNFKSHQVTHHPDEEWPEPEVSKQEENPGGALYCPLCPAASYHEQKLKAHLEAHTIDDPWTCEVCTIPFLRLATLQDHRKVAHNLTTDVLEAEGVTVPLPNSQETFYCDKCPASYLGSGALKAHVKAHRLRGAVPCPVCAIVFASKKGLMSHQNTTSCGEKLDTPGKGPAKRHAFDDDAEESKESENKKQRVDAGEDKTNIEEASRVEDEHSCLNQELPKQLFTEAEDPIA